MRVKDVMTVDTTCCAPASSLADTAGLMWERDCGVIPVIDEEQRIIGMITDRDICMAAAMTGKDLANIAVHEVISGPVCGCTSEDDIHQALVKMRENQLRRLPVLDDEGKLQGILSLNDVVLKADQDKKAASLAADVLETLKAISRHREAEQQTRVAGAS
ncbi:MAG TPA: CBS domain-containing protein [Pyrinomonadaceae bacterium]|nr:CBS domain-containing protein [Pyrinomonadaceae bacterium]